MKVSDIFLALRKTSSLNEKRDILKKNENNLVLKEIFRMVNTPSVNFFLRVEADLNVSGGDLITTPLLESLNSNIVERKITGNAARDWVKSVMETLDPGEQTVFRNLINRDMDCGVGKELVNKTWKNLIPEMPCMLADKYDPNKKNCFSDLETSRASGNLPKIIVQTKCDGLRAQFHVDLDGNVKAYTRSGNELLLHGTFDYLLQPFSGHVVDGELIILTETGVEDRKTSNGIANKSVRGTITPEEAAQFTFVCWDVIPENSFWNSDFFDVPYEKRLSTLTSKVNTINNARVQLVDTKFVYTVAEALEFYERQLSKGLEGAMLKDASMPWENKRSKRMLKLKEEKECTLLCVGVTPHTKDPTKIGSLLLESSDGYLKVNTGSGLLDEDRNKTPDYFVGKLVNVKYNATIRAKDSETMSLFLPIFKGLRFDVLEADSVEKVK